MVGDVAGEGDGGGEDMPTAGADGTARPGAAADAGLSAPAPTATDRAGRADRRSRWRVVGQVAAWTTAVVAVAVVLLVFVFPTKTYVAQRRQLTQTASELRFLDGQNAQLSAEVARLRTDQEIERLARQQYHLVRPGESAIAILPPPVPPAPAASPAPPPARHASLLHRLTNWLP